MKKFIFGFVLFFILFFGLKNLEAIKIKGDTVESKGEIILKEIAPPSTPPTGKVFLYSKTDKKLYTKDDTGLESSAGGSGDVSQALANNSILGFSFLEQNLLSDLPLEDGFIGRFQTSVNKIDETASTGETYDATFDFYGNTAGSTSNQDVNFVTESDFVQQEWTNSNQSTSQATATLGSASVTISSGSWPTNVVGARITLDNGVNFYNVSTRNSATQITLENNFNEANTTADYRILFSAFSGGSVKLNSVSNAIDSSTKLLLHGDGADASTIFTDESNTPHTVTAGGASANTQIDTAQSQFGGASILFDGTTDNLNSADSADWQLGGGTGDFTIDFWVRFNAFQAGARNFIVAQAQDANNHWVLEYRDVADELLFFNTTASTLNLLVQKSWAASLATWYHVAFVRTGNDFKMFIDGTQIGTTVTDADAVGNHTASLILGEDPLTAGREFNGWLDEFRISNVARWTTNFTRPTQPYGGGSPANEYASVSLSQSKSIPSGAWTDINSGAVTEILNGQSLFYWYLFDPVASLGANTTVKIFNQTGSVWRVIAKNDAGTWKYNSDLTDTAAETLTACTVNDFLHCVSQAVSNTGNHNQMTGTDLGNITDVEFEASGGWSTSINQIMEGVTLFSNDDQMNPEVSQIRLNIDGPEAMTLISKSFVISPKVPDKLFLFAVENRNAGTPVYFATRDGGGGPATWTNITMEEVGQLSDGRKLLRGLNDVTSSPSGSDIRMRIESGAGNDYELHGLSLMPVN